MNLGHVKHPCYAAYAPFISVQKKGLRTWTWVKKLCALIYPYLNTGINTIMAHKRSLLFQYLKQASLPDLSMVKQWGFYLVCNCLCHFMWRWWVNLKWCFRHVSCIMSMVSMQKHSPVWHNLPHFFLTPWIKMICMCMLSSSTTISWLSHSGITVPLTCCLPIWL